MMEPRPRLTVNRADATGDVAILRADGVALALPVEPSDAVPPGVVAVSPNFPETRMLFAWSASGVGPKHVTMEAGRGDD
jgi:hypothetical protein